MDVWDKFFGRQDKPPRGYRYCKGKCPSCGSYLFERDTAGVPSGESFRCSDDACGHTFKKTSAKIEAEIKKAVDTAHADIQRGFEDLRTQQNLVVRWIRANRPSFLGKFKDFSTMCIKIMEGAPAPPRWEGDRPDGH